MHQRFFEARVFCVSLCLKNFVRYNRHNPGC